MESEGFIFYKSWYDALGCLTRDERIEALEDIIEYGLYGETPEEQSHIARAIFLLVKPQIDANISTL